MKSAIPDASVIRASERLKLACRALAAASNDLLLAMRSDDVPINETARELNVEVERVCELAEQLEDCVANLSNLAGARR